MKGCKSTSRLSAVCLGLAFGVISGLSMCLFAWLALWQGLGATMVSQWAEIYPGYAATIQGGLIGGAWGLLEGLIVGLVVAWVYNFFLCCCKCMCGCQNCKSGGSSCNIQNN